VLCHGFPESWYSWRHQLTALGDAGYHVVAPDQRGYGQTDAPEAIDQYTQLHLVGDIIGLLDALDAPTAVIAGHDWGAPVAWNTALWRPDRIRAVIGLSVPFGARAPMRPTQLLDMAFGETFMYILYFQEPGVAEADLEKDVRRTIAASCTSRRVTSIRAEITGGKQAAARRCPTTSSTRGAAVVAPARTSTSTGEFERAASVAASTGTATSTARGADAPRGRAQSSRRRPSSSPVTVTA
jgi:pimeloyl-ACP methyl ester carboxylesterase